MNRLLRFVSIAALAGVTACSAAGGAGPPQPADRFTSVTFSISIPSGKPANARRKIQYISANTSSATVGVAPIGGATVTYPIACSGSTCSGTVQAPIGTDSFIVKLLSASGSVLSSASLTKTIVAGATNALNLTFNPVVASVALTFDASASAAPYLSKNGPSGVVIDVLAKDASGATIVGPGTYIDASGNPLTVTLSDADSATALSRTVFNSSNTSINTTTLSLTGSAPAFDTPSITVSVSGATGVTVSGIDVPVSPVMSYSSSTCFAMTSMYGPDATSNNGSPALCIPSSRPNVTPDPASGIGFLTGGTRDGNEWFFENGVTGAAATAPNEFAYVTPSLSVGRGAAVAYQVALTAAGGDGNLWFLEGDTKTVGRLNVTVPTAAPAVAPAVSNPVRALLPGGSSAMIAVALSAGGTVYYDTIAPDMSVSERSSGTPVSGIDEAGYSPIDGRVYFTDSATGNLYAGDPKTGNTVLAGNLPGLQGFGGAMTTLARDGSLAYIVTSGASFVHIIPSPARGAPRLFTVVAQPDANCTLVGASCRFGSLTSLTPDGTANSSDGGNSRVAIW